MTTTTNAILAPEPLLPLHEHSSGSPLEPWNAPRVPVLLCLRIDAVGHHLRVAAHPDSHVRALWPTRLLRAADCPARRMDYGAHPQSAGALPAPFEWLFPSSFPGHHGGRGDLRSRGAGVGPALDRGRTKAHPRLFVWLHTLMRFLLGATMLWYGWAKVLPLQFAMTLDYMALEAAQHNPRDLLWAFMIGSRDYQIFTGFVEVAGGLLLLTRRTAMLGAIISMAAMANVLALDISYDEPIKFLAGQLFFPTESVCAGAFRYTLLFGVRSHPRRTRGTGSTLVPIRISRPNGPCGRRSPRRLDRLDDVTGLPKRIARKNRARQANAILGIWDVEEMTKNGTSVPLLITDATLWRRLVAHSNNAAVIVPMTQLAPQSQWTGRPTTVRCNVRLDSASQTVQFTPFPFLGAVGPVDFAYALPDPDHLVLTSRNQNETTVVVRLRRFDLSAYPLLNWERHWSW